MKLNNFWDFSLKNHKEDFHINLFNLYSNFIYNKSKYNRKFYDFQNF